MSKKGRKDCAGFTLIEVLVALTILSISLAALLQIFTSTLNRLDANRTLTIATALDQSLLAETGVVQPIRFGDSEGVFPNGFRWRLHAEPYGTPQDQNAWPVSAVRITAETLWDGGPKAVRLSALKFAPKAKP